MDEVVSDSQYSVPPKRILLRSQSRRIMISMGAALLALTVTWAIVFAYSTTSNLPQ